MVYDALTLILCSVPVHEEMSFIAWLVLVLVSHSLLVPTLCFMVFNALLGGVLLPPNLHIFPH